MILAFHLPEDTRGWPFLSPLQGIMGEEALASMSFARHRGDVIFNLKQEASRGTSSLALSAPGHHGKYSLGSIIITFFLEGINNNIVWGMGIWLCWYGTWPQKYESLSSDPQHLCRKARYSEHICSCRGLEGRRIPGAGWQPVSST